MVDESEARANHVMFMQDVARDLENVFKSSSLVPIHDGFLRNSITVIPEGGDLNISMVRYGEYVEYGTRPHSVDPKQLKKWCKDKLGDENLAYALSLHIKKHGTKPHPFIRPILHQMLPKIVSVRKAQYGIY